DHHSVLLANIELGQAHGPNPLWDLSRRAGFYGRGSIHQHLLRTASSPDNTDGRPLIDSFTIRGRNAGRVLRKTHFHVDLQKSAAGKCGKHDQVFLVESTVRNAGSKPRTGR